MACSSSNRNSASARASLGLADSSRAQEDEASERPIRVLQTGTGATDGIADGFDRLILADHTLVQPLLHVDELLDLAFHQPPDRDARPFADDFSDVVGVNLLLEELAGRLRLAEPSLLVFELLLLLHSFPYCSSEARP